MKHLKVILAGVAALALSACGEKGSLVGMWIQPVPGMGGIEQGFMLKADGKAFSVNMSTLSYEAWQEKDNRLILSGKSMGNHQTIEFSDTFDIEKLTSDSLILRKNDLKLEYARCDSDTIPATLILPAKVKGEVEGVLIIGHEVRELSIEGDSCRYWIVDKTGNLIHRYDSVTKGSKNGKPVLVRLQVVDAGKPDYGFAKNYDRVLDVVEIESMALCDK